MVIPQRLLPKTLLSLKFGDWPATVTVRGSGVLLLNQLPGDDTLNELPCFPGPFVWRRRIQNFPRALARITALFTGDLVDGPGGWAQRRSMSPLWRKGTKSTYTRAGNTALQSVCEVWGFHTTRRCAIPGPCLGASNHFLLGQSTICKVTINASEATLPHLYLWIVHGRCQ